jgi:isoleucyl-tRNA synthetase
MVDDELARQMALVRRLVELGRSTRAGSGVKTRQPLARALVAAPGWAELSPDLRQQLAEELNVGRVEALSDLDGGTAGPAAGDLVDVQAKGNFRALGRRFGQRTPAVAAAVAAADARSLVAGLRGSGHARVEVDGEAVLVTADEVVVTETPRRGWAVATDGGETVAVDLEVTPELRLAGLARDVVRLLQEARKSAGLQITDRIQVRWAAYGEVAVALREHGSAVAEEVLAVSFEEGTPATGPGETAYVTGHDAETGLNFALRPVQG